MNVWKKNEFLRILTGMILTSLQPARQKICKLINPKTIGQASRISGVNPADISILSVLLGR